MNGRLSTLVFTFLLAAFAASCSSSMPLEATTHRAADAPILAPTDSSSVQLLSKAPGPDYVVLGDVRLRMKAVRSGRDGDLLNDPAILQAMRAQAAALGADAVIEIFVLHQAGTAAGTLGPSTAIPVEVRGTAIRTTS